MNLAARLEGANKFFGTSIMVAETTVVLTGSAFSWRELDAIRVKGRSQPVRIYEPLAEAGRESPEQATRAGTCVQAIGPGAAIGAALPTGVISRYDALKVATLTSE